MIGPAAAPAGLGLERDLNLQSLKTSGARTRPIPGPGRPGAGGLRVGSSSQAAKPEHGPGHESCPPGRRPPAGIMMIIMMMSEAGTDSCQWLPRTRTVSGRDSGWSFPESSHVAGGGGRASLRLKSQLEGFTSKPVTVRVRLGLLLA